MNAKELEKLLAEVTPGDWVVERMSEAGPTAISGIGPCRADGYQGAVWLDISDCDARLIAMAPTLARRVIAAEKLAESLRDAKSALEWCARDGRMQTKTQTLLVQKWAAEYDNALAAWDAAQ